MPLPDPGQTPNWGEQLNDYILGVEATASASLVKSSNLSDLTDAPAARSNMGLGGAAVLNVGTGTGTVAAGDDSRITGAVQDTRQVIAGTGLTGGGTLAADRTLTVSYGTSSGTAAQGNDTRITGAVQNTRQVLAGTGLTGGGALSSDVTLTVAYGTSSTTAAVGNDSRITGAYQSTGGTVTGTLDVNGQALGMHTPRSHGILAWAYDPAVVTNGAAATNGTCYFVQLQVNRSTTATKIYWGLNTAATTPTSSQNHIGLYNSSGTRLTTTDITAKMTATGMQTETISQAVTPGLYWIGFVMNASTPGQPYRSGGLDVSLVNVGLTASTARYATNGTGATTLPSSITPGSNTIHHVAWWVALG